MPPKELYIRIDPVLARKAIRNSARRKRQQERRNRLNEKAKALGFESWSKFETAVINEKTYIELHEALYYP